MMIIQPFVFNPFSENTYIVYDETKEAIVIDPGCYEKEEKAILDRFIHDNQLTVVYLLNTHCHIDHVLGNDHVKSKYKVPFLMHAKEQPLLRAVKAYAPNYGFEGYREVTPDKFLDDGDVITWGKSRLDVIFLPGHSPGHLGFYSATQKILLSGDVLFDGSVGRTDLPGGDMDTLIQSIHSRLFVLPDEVVVHSGHGGETTLGKEKMSNPFCSLATRK
jgi:hydroxyacylglutathione hydrolase